MADTPAEIAKEKPEQHAQPAPDPEEDELDDLDDVLDEFQPKPAAAATSAPPTASAAAPSTSSTSASGPGRPHDADTAAAAALSSHGLPNDEELASQLQAGMSSLISELDANPDMQQEFEKMMQELIAASSAPTDKEAVEHIGKATEAIKLGSGSGKPVTADKGATDFQSTIRKTMDRMRASEEAATTAASSSKPFNEADLLAQMMKELGDAGGDGEADFNTMLMNMMAQLTHKDILYEPMKELHDKFPAWMVANKGKTSAEDMARFEEQQKMVTEIVGRFEKKGYSDDNAEDRDYIVERMQKMQAAGAPPPDLVGDMSAAQEALGDLESGCPTQ